MSKKTEKVVETEAVPTGTTYVIVVGGSDGEALTALYGTNVFHVISPDAIPARRQDGDLFWFPDCDLTTPDGTAITLTDPDGTFAFDQRSAYVVDVIEGGDGSEPAP